MRTPRVPSYRLHKPSGQAVVTLSGRDHYLGVYDTPASRERYARLVAEWLAAGASPARPADPTVSEVLTAYLAFAGGYYRKGGSPTTQLERVRRSLAPVRRLYGGLPARDFGPLALQAVRADMVRAGLCRRVVNQRADCVKRCFKWAAAQELVPGGTYEALRAVAGLRAGRTEAPDRAPVLPAPEADVASTLPFLSPHLADAARLQLLTGARPGEALALRPRDLDRAGAVWLYRPGSHKTEHHGHARVVFLGPKAQALLAPRLEGLGPDDYAFCPRRADAERKARMRAARKTPVQPSQRDRSKARPGKSPGERYSVRTYASAVALACRKAGCEPWSPHRLRHTAATRMVEEFGWDVARILLGQRTLSATRIYAEDAAAKAKEAARKAG